MFQTCDTTQALFTGETQADVVEQQKVDSCSWVCEWGPYGVDNFFHKAMGSLMGGESNP